MSMPAEPLTDEQRQQLLRWRLAKILPSASPTWAFPRWPARPKSSSDWQKLFCKAKR